MSMSCNESTVNKHGYGKSLKLMQMYIKNAKYHRYIIITRRALSRAPTLNSDRETLNMVT